jgi:hypothetical protein
MGISMVLRSLFFSLLPLLLFAEGPLLHEDQIYTKFSWQNYKTDEVFDCEGVVRENCNHFLQNKYILQGDVGLNEMNTLSHVFGYIRAEEELDGNTGGFTDFRVTLKHAFIRTTTKVLSLEIMANIPLAGHYEPAVRFGNLGTGLMLFYAFQDSVYSWPLLVSLGAGGAIYYRIEDFLKVYARFTLCPTGLVALRATFHLDYGLNNGKHLMNASLVDFNPNERVLRGDFDLVIRPISCLEITVGYFNNFWGRNVGYGGGFIGTIGYYF